MKLSRRQLRSLISKQISLNELDQRINVTTQDYEGGESGEEHTRSRSNMGGEGDDDQREGTVAFQGKKYDYSYEKVKLNRGDEEMGLSIGQAGEIGKAQGSYIQIETSKNKKSFLKFVKGKKKLYSSMGDLLSDAADIGLTEDVLNKVLAEMDKENVPMVDELESEVKNLSENFGMTRRQLRKVISETLKESNSSRADAMAAALAAIEGKFGAGAIMDTGAGERLSNDWMKYVSRQSPKHQEVLFRAWDEMVQTGGKMDKLSKIQDKYFPELDNNSGVTGAITFYGRRIRAGEQYRTGAEMAAQVSSAAAEKRAQQSQRDQAALSKREAQIARLQGMSLETLKSQRREFLDSLETSASNTRYPYGRNRGDVRSVTSYQKPDGTAFTQDEIQMLEDYDLKDAEQHGGYAALAGTTSSSLSSDSMTLTITYSKHTAG